MTKNPKETSERSHRRNVVWECAWRAVLNSNTPSVRYSVYLTFHPNERFHQIASQPIKPFLLCPSIIQSYLLGCNSVHSQLIYEALNPHKSAYQMESHSVYPHTINNHIHQTCA